MTNKIHREIIIPETLSDMRLDQALAKLLPEYSRTQIQEWIKNTSILINGKPTKTKADKKEKRILNTNPQATYAWGLR